MNANLLKFDDLDCTSLASELAKQGVTVTELADLSGKVSHVAYGGASKSSYTSPKSGKTIYVLEREQTYAADAFHTEVWQFDADFTVEEAAEFIRQYDAAKATR